MSILKSLAHLLLILFIGFVFSCSDDEQSPNSIEYIDFCLVLVDGEFQDIALDLEPEFIENGQDGLVDAFYGEIKYPAIARENGTEGTCILEYEITTTGSVENVIILQDIGDGCGAESKRVLEVATEGNSFNPGMLNNIPHRVKKRQAIKFRLG